jgi:hypothetical protein
VTARRRSRRQRTPELEPLLDELTDESEDERRDFTNLQRNLFESEHGPVMGSDGDDNPEYARPKLRADMDKPAGGKKLADDITKPEDIVYRIQRNKQDTKPGEMVEAGHGFIVNDPRSRPWKTARRTHCAHCGDPLPAPDVSKYRCEFDPDASIVELALVGADHGPDDRPLWSRPLDPHSGCQCSGCTLRWLVGNGRERNRGQPRKYCTDDCLKWADNARKAWKRAVRTAEKRGEELPPEPEDKGLKHRAARGLRSSAEGTGRRYVAATGHRWSLPTV